MPHEIELPEPDYRLTPDGYVDGRKLDAGHAKETLLPLYTADTVVKIVAARDLEIQRLREFLKSLSAKCPEGLGLQLLIANQLHELVGNAEEIVVCQHARCEDEDINNSVCAGVVGLPTEP